MRKDGRTLHRESRGGGLSYNMVRNCHSLCRRALEKAVSDRLIVKNPIKGCKAPPIRREEMQLLTREELQRLLIQAKDEGYYEVFLLELTTGLRVGELMALQWDDLNFKTGELRIERQVYRTKEELLIQEPKTKASIRTVILPHLWPRPCGYISRLYPHDGCSPLRKKRTPRWLQPPPVTG